MSASVSTTSTFMKLHYSCQLAERRADVPQTLMFSSDRRKTNFSQRHREHGEQSVFSSLWPLRLCEKSLILSFRRLPSPRTDRSKAWHLKPLSTPSPACQRQRTAYWP